MKKLVATAVAMAVGVSVAMADPSANGGEATPMTDNKPAAQSPAPKVVKKVVKKHHKHHKVKKQVEKQAEQKPADQNEQPK